MVHKILLSVLLLFVQLSTFAQPILEVKPAQIVFDNLFNRNEPVKFINRGNAPLTIDQIGYNYDYYFIRFNKPFHYPYTLNPGDSISMDCILTFFYSFTTRDSADTMLIHTNQPGGFTKVPISIKLIGPEYENGAVTGKIKYANTGVPGAAVYFLFDGIYLFDSTVTDNNGNYFKLLPPGKYTVAAKKDSFHLTFYDSRTDPFNAKYIKVLQGSTNTLDIAILKATIAQRSISGTIYDSLSNGALKKGVVVIKKGTHTPPNKITEIEPFTGYAGIIKPDGSYIIDNIPTDGDYYLQTFSDYFVPSYFSSSGIYPAFWSEAQPVSINGQISNKNILMPRDSSTGEGSISGFIYKNKTMEEDSSFNDAIVMAVSMDYNIPFSYSFVEAGEFEIEHLPYGRYKLIGQKIGYQNTLSTNLIISPQVTKIENVNLYFSPVDVNEDIITASFALENNYPNPFNPATTISFTLSERGLTTLKVYDILGKEIALIFNDFLEAGRHSFNFDAGSLAGGVYIYELKSGLNKAAGKMIYLK